MANERTPLLRGYVAGTSEAPENDPSLKFSKAARVIRLVLVAALLALIAAFITALAIPTSKNEPETKTEEICTSAGCVLAAANILRGLSPKHEDIDPCTDFHDYVCEGWDASHNIAPDQSSVSALSLIRDENQLLLKYILESPQPERFSTFWAASSPDQEIFNKLHDGYAACMNETLLQAIGDKPLLKLLYGLEDRYPVTKNESIDASSLTSALEYLMSIGVTGPIGLGVGADDKNPDSNIITLEVPYSFGLPARQYYNRTDVVDAYKSTIEAVLVALAKEAHKEKMTILRDSNGLYTNSKELVDSIVSLEKRMAYASPDSEDLQDITKVYNPRTLNEAESYNKEVSVKSLIKSFAGDYRPTKIIVTSPEYQQTLSQILASEDPKTILAYLVWKVVQDYGDAIESDAITPLRRFNNVLRGQAPDVTHERWKTCIDVVNSDLPWILSRFFIERAFSEEAKALGDRVIHDIKDEFAKKLKAFEWMSEDVRKLAIDKVGLIRQKIGYSTISPDVTDAAALQKFYSQIEIHADTFFDNRLSAVKNGIEREWSDVDKPVDKETWGMSAPTVNAYYNPAGNEIVFPAGIMQAPVFYDPSIPKYLSYGAFGAVAGHELSHAFDSNGRNYDQNGNYTDWWDDSTITAFKEKAECFVEQYHNYTVPTKNGLLRVNGVLTLGENIADAGGLTAAFQSWKSRDKENADLILPGLQEFSKEQMFFLAYGSLWCGKSREEYAERLLYQDPHSPPQYRIKGTTSNSREFREAFNCPVKEPTCELW